MADRELRRHRRNLIWQKILTGGAAAVFFALVNMMFLPGAELEVRATEVSSTDTKCILTYDDEDENLKGTTVEVMISEVVNTDSEYSIKQSEAGKALRMLKEVSEDQFTNLAFPIYDIKILSNGAEKKPASEVTVKIQLPPSGYSAGDVKTVVHFTGNGIRTIKGEVVSDGVNLYMSFKTKTFSDFMITDIEGVESNIWIVENDDELRCAIEDTTFNGTIVIDAKGDGKDFIIEYAPGEGAPQLKNGTRTINLNSHHITVNGTFIDVKVNSTLTIKDDPVTENPPESSLAVYGNVAEYDSLTKTLTYYVTKTNKVDGKVGKTVETVEKHVAVGNGVITGTGNLGALFYVTDASTLNIENGMFVNSQNRAVEILGGSHLNISGGYLCGNNIAYDGGAIWAYGASTVNISNNAVIAGNSAKNGGAIYLDTASMEMTDGIITGNEAAVNGGGIVASGVNNFVITGGYITNNIASLQDNNNENGGGGVILYGNSKLTMNGGFITGNYAASGGGIYFSNNVSGAKFEMNDGYITANRAQKGEGGGIRVSANALANFIGGYITNNTTATDQHWGGGGIFIAEGAFGYAEKVLVKENTADGFGGGVAGCSTGQIYMSNENNTAATKGVAIYSNIAYGKNLSGGTSAKHDDHSYAARDKVFTDNGYQDYFSMLYSHIADSMLGGGHHNWSGSIDGQQIGSGVVILQGGTQTSNSVAGLTSNPSDPNNSTNPYQAAEEKALVYVTGNTSNTHGGGILCNGYMIFGEPPSEITASTRLEVHGTVQYLNWASNPITMIDDQFTFQITEDENANTKKTNGANYVNGEITFMHRLVFPEEGTDGEKYYYYIQQTSPDFPNGEIDRSEYKITVTLSDGDSTTIPTPTGGTITVNMRKIVLVEIAKKEVDSDSWNELGPTTISNVDEQYNHAVAVYLRDPADSTAYSFTNYNLTTTPPPADNPSSSNTQPSAPAEIPDTEISEEVVTQTAEGQLPQTGQNWMSVILLACAGCLCFIIGIALKRVEHEWD